MRVSEGLESRRVAAVLVTVLGAGVSIAWVLANRAPLIGSASFIAVLTLTAIGTELLSVELPGCEGGITVVLPFAATLAVVWCPAASLGLLIVTGCGGALLLRKRRGVALILTQLATISIAAGVATLVLIFGRRLVPGAGAAPFAAIAFMAGYAATAYLGGRYIETGVTGAKPPPREIPVTGLGGATIALFGVLAIVVAVAAVDGLTWLVPFTLIPVWALGCGLRMRARMSESYYETVTALTLMLQRAHPYTHEHVDRVARTAEQVARQLGLPSERARLVRAAAVLHDIGKIAVDESILDKPGALSESERRHVENHPAWGAQILAPVRQFHDLLPWIRHHHERPDGTGYPDGLSDVEIPIESKIIAVVDAYDAMTDSGRRYRAPLTPLEAIEELRRCSGTQFDSAVVEVFGEMVTQKGRLMHPITILVVLAAAVATGWLAFYVFVQLPREMDEQYRESLQAFSTAVELRFPSHRGLSHRVAALSKEVGRRQGLSRKRLADLDMAARLRDVGLCAIPYRMVNDRSPHTWNAAEEHTYERHSEISGAMLELVPHLNHLAPIVRHHHVEFASDKRVSEVLRSQVPLESFILNAVSAYVWAERLEGPQSARAQLRDGSGTKYDPKVVETLLQVLPSQRVGATRAEEFAQK